MIKILSISENSTADSMFPFFREIFSIEFILGFLRLVGKESKIRYTKILRDFSISMSQKIQEDEYLDAIEDRNIDTFLLRSFHGKTIVERIEEIQAGLSLQAVNLFRQGMQEGKGYKEISYSIKRLVANEATNVERLIRTEGQRIQNDILLTTYHKNRNVIDGIMFLATLDMRTCETCAQYDRHEYFYNGNPSVMHAPYTPLHPMCRCIYVPITQRIGANTRASMFGYTKEDYPTWLKNADERRPGFAKDILGSKYQAWKSGNYKLTAQFTPEITYRNFLQQTKDIR